MALRTDSIKKILDIYIQRLMENDIPIQLAIMFGSYARGNPRKESDIDIALISTSFTGDRFEDRRKIIPFRRDIDNRIDPIPFKPEEFFKGGNLIDEIKLIGKVIYSTPS